MQVDVGFGGAVGPEAEMQTFPTILREISAPLLWMYPSECVVAEKLHAMVVLDIGNSRMKDFYDVWYLSRSKAFDLRRLRAAIAATFERRRTEVPREIPFALTLGFLEDSAKVSQWAGFLRRLRLEDVPELKHIGAQISEFVMPGFRGEESDSQWPAGGPWSGVS